MGLNARGGPWLLSVRVVRCRGRHDWVITTCRSGKVRLTIPRLDGLLECEDFVEGFLKDSDVVVNERFLFPWIIISHDADQSEIPKIQCC